MRKMIVLWGVLVAHLSPAFADLPNVWDEETVVVGAYGVRISTKNLRDPEGVLEVLGKLASDRGRRVIPAGVPSFPTVLADEQALEVTFRKIEGLDFTDEQLHAHVKKVATDVETLTGEGTVTLEKGTKLRVSLKALKGSKDMLELIQALGKRESVVADFPRTSSKAQSFALSVSARKGKKRAEVEKDMTDLVEKVEAVTGKGTVKLEAIPKMFVPK